MGPGCPHTLCSLSAPDAPCSFPKVAVTNDHKLSDHRSLFSHGSRGRKSGVKVSEGLVTSGGFMGEACPRLSQLPVVSRNLSSSWLVDALSLQALP